jgi:hypothetical protein
MRPFILCLLCLSCIGSFSVLGQETNLLNRKISVAFSNTPIRTVLSGIADKGHFSLSYNPNLVDDSKKITLTKQNRTVNEIMLDVLGSGYRFKVNGNYLILLKVNKPDGELLGYVRDPASGKGIAHVSVYDKKTLKSAVTDDEGFYRLPVRDSSQIIVTRIGYRDTIIQLQPAMQRFQEIDLKPIEQNSSQQFSREVHYTLDYLVWVVGEKLDSTQFWRLNNIPDTINRPFQFSILPYVGTNHKLSNKVSNALSINLLGGISAATNGVEIAGGFNHTNREINGLQAAGAYNANQGDTKGAQLAGVFNQTGDTLSGLQAAGVFNRCGAQVAHSTQLAGAVNLGGGNDAPINQAAGVYNQAFSTDYFQLAGAVNIAQNMQGLQAAGAFNSAYEAVGVQISLVNKTHKLRGAQIGVFNWSNDTKGLQFGLINRNDKRVLPIVNW